MARTGHPGWHGLRDAGRRQVSQHGLPDDRGRERRLHGAHQPAVTQHADALDQVGDLAQSVGDVEHRDAPGRQGTNAPEESLRLAFGERGRRLVEDEQAGLPGERATDEDLLPVAGADAFDGSVEVELEVECGRDGCRGLPSDVPAVAGACGRIAQAIDGQVLGHRVARQDARADLLVHGLDAGPVRERGVAQGHLPTVDAERCPRPAAPHPTASG